MAGGVQKSVPGTYTERAYLRHYESFEDLYGFVQVLFLLKFGVLPEKQHKKPIFTLVFPEKIWHTDHILYILYGWDVDDMKKRWIALLAMGLAAALNGCALFPDEEETLAPPLKAPAAVTYTTTKAERGEIVDSVSLNGTFIAPAAYDLSFGIRSGYLSEMGLKPWDEVEAGQVLARLDSEELELQIAQQELALERAQIAYRMAKNASGSGSDAAQLAWIDVESAQLNLDQSKKELENLTIHAPIDGVVSYITASTVGEYIQGRSTVVRVVDPSELQVQCTGEDAGQFPLGSEVVLTYNREEYAGRVVMTTLEKPDDVQIEGSFVRVAMDEEIPEDNLELLGKSVTVKLIREKKTDAVLVPRNTVSSYGGESYVLVLEDGVKKERPVEVGIKTSSTVEIVCGLEAGEEVIIK